MAAFHVDSFSGEVTDLKRGQRTPENVLAILRTAPLVSTWDMENAWLRRCLEELKQSGRITQDDSQPYPWLRFVVKEAS